MEEKEQFRPRLNAAENRLISEYRGDLPSKDETKTYLVLGCVHVPFQNKPIMSGILEMMEHVRFDGIVLAGDFIDMCALGQYEKGKVSHTGVTLEDEYEAADSLLSEFESRLKKGAEKVFMFGNHEERYWRWKADVNNHKYGDPLNPIKALKLKERGFKVYSNYKEDIHKIGSLSVMHGEYYNIHCAKKHMDVFRRNVLFFHTHRVQIHREGDFAGYNAGFLGDIHSKAFGYAPRGMKSAWGNGFGIVTLDKEEQHHVTVVNCVNDKFTFGGKIYGGESYEKNS